jgi:hypothetical protein
MTDFTRLESALVKLQPNDGGPIHYFYRPLLNAFSMLNDAVRECKSTEMDVIPVRLASKTLAHVLEARLDPFAEVLQSLSIAEKIELVKGFDYLGGDMRGGSYEGFDPLGDMLFESLQDKNHISGEDLQRFITKSRLNPSRIRDMLQILEHFNTSGGN